jgi:4-hydroxybenzoate polyprenyltransferase
MASTATLGYIDPNLLPLYLAGVCWTLVYDTIYACQDIKDDLIVGIKSTAITFRNGLGRWLGVFSGCSVGMFVYSGYLLGLGPVYYLFAGLVPALHYSWQILTLRVDDGKDCWDKFRSNQYLGMSVSMGIFGDWGVRSGVFGEWMVSLSSWVSSLSSWVSSMTLLWF